MRFNNWIEISSFNFKLGWKLSGWEFVGWVSRDKYDLQISFSEYATKFYFERWSNFIGFEIFLKKLRHISNKQFKLLLGPKNSPYAKRKKKSQFPSEGHQI